MQISRAIKSIVDGMSTDSKRTRSRIHLEDQKNMSIIDGSGLHRRPPTELIASNIDDFISTIANPRYWTKEFSMRDEQYFLLVLWSTTVATTRVLVVSDTGTIITVTETLELNFDYLKNEDPNRINVTVNGDTLYIVNKDITVLKDPAVRTSQNVSYVRVKRAALEGTKLKVSWTDPDEVAYAITHTVLATPELQATDHLASVLATAINLTATTTLASSRGSILALSSLGGFTSVSTEDDSDGEILQSINGAVDEVGQLPAYVLDTGEQTLTVAPDEKSRGTYYMKSVISGTVAVPPPLVADTVMTPGLFTLGTFRYTGYSVTGLFGSGAFGSLSVPITIGGATVDQFYVVSDSADGSQVLHIQASPDFSSSSDILHIAVEIGAALGNFYIDTTMTPVDLGGGNWAFRADVNEELTGNSPIYVNQAGIGSDLIATDWEETSKAGEQYKLNKLTMPQILSNVNDVWNINSVDWDEKIAGDDITNPDPDFVNSEVNDITLFQNRLVVLTKDLLNTSETGNLFSWYRNTVTQLLPTHPVRVFSTVADASELYTALNHDKELLIFSKNRQFKLSGEIPLTPNSGLPVTTSYANTAIIKPLSLGNKVYFPFLYAENSAGLAQYEPSDGTDVRDKAIPITDHTRGLINTDIDLLMGDANVGKLVAVNLDTNTLYMCDFTEITQGVGADNRKLAWHYWKLDIDALNTKIVNCSYHDSKISLLTLRNDTKLDLLELKINANPQVQADNLYIDYVDTATYAGGDSIIFGAPFDVLIPTAKIYNSEIGDSNYGKEVQITGFSGGAYLLQEGLDTNIKLSIGLDVESYVTLSEEFIRDEGGMINSKSRLTIQRYEVSLSNSADITADILTSLQDKLPQQYWSGNVVGSLLAQSSPVGETDKFIVEVGERSEMATLKLSTTGVNKMHIEDIQFIGSYSSRGRRF